MLEVVTLLELAFVFPSFGASVISLVRLTVLFSAPSFTTLEFKVLSSLMLLLLLLVLVLLSLSESVEERESEDEYVVEELGHFEKLE